MAEAIAELATPDIDATDITLNADALGLGKPWESTNAALQADAGQPGPDPSAAGGPDIMSLLGGGQGIPQELKNEFIKLQKGKMGAMADIQGQTEARYNEDRQRVLQQYGAENATTNDIPKWDVAAERQKYHTDPLESFGSFASIFAMVASAFTRAPMENALNGAAAAMNARRENNEFEYQRSMDAFKLNSDLAIKRFNMQHAAMQDAFGIMEKDVQRGNAKLLETATKYGDEQVLALYNAGMFPEIQKLEDSRMQASIGLSNAKVNILRMEEQEKRNKTLEAAETTRATETQRHNKAMEGRQTPDQEFAARWKEENPEGTSAQFAEAYDKFSQGKKAPGGGIVTGPREQEAEAKRRYEYDQAHDSLEPEEKKRRSDWDAAHKGVRQGAPLSEYQQTRIAEKTAKIESVTNQVERALQLIERAADKEKVVTGAAGALGTAKEWLFGGGTEHAEFAQMIRTIQSEVPPILKGSTRLGPEDRKTIDVVVPGLGFMRNTEQVYEGLNSLLKILRKQNLLEDKAATGADDIAIDEVVRQNGKLFKKQPDGSMKEVKP